MSSYRNEEYLQGFEDGIEWHQGIGTKRTAYIAFIAGLVCAFIPAFFTLVFCLAAN